MVGRVLILIRVMFAGYQLVAMIIGVDLTCYFTDSDPLFWTLIYRYGSIFDCLQKYFNGDDKKKLPQRFELWQRDLKSRVLTTRRQKQFCTYVHSIFLLKSLYSKGLTSSSFQQLLDFKFHFYVLSTMSKQFIRLRNIIY